MKKYLFIAVILLSVLLVFSLAVNAKNRQERQRLSDNQRTLMADVYYYRTKDSLSAASVERLELSKREMMEYQSKLVADIENLGVKIRRLQSAAVTGTQTTVEIKTVVRDSIIYRDGIIDTVPCVSFKDPWVSFEGCSFGSNFQGLIVSRDTLVQVVHRVPHEWCIFRWGTKGIRQEITSKNPHTIITYSEYIELKK